MQDTGLVNKWDEFISALIQMFPKYIKEPIVYAVILLTVLVLTALCSIPTRKDRVKVFFLVIYCFWVFVQENLYTISLIILLGFCYSVVLYNFMTGLHRGILEENPHWYYKIVGKSRNYKDSFALDILLNDKAICVILCFICMFNIFMVVCRVVYFLHEDSLTQIFALEDQFFVLLAILGFEIGFMYIIRVKLLMGKSQALDITQMAKAGKYAVPVLIRLPEWDMPYGYEGKKSLR